ncbi:MAG TPA: hypothetical protein O0X70_06130, partial [Methanocorpusculum sp.]|nr:hypothetical protein [Methanocorpusculum sp.]
VVMSVVTSVQALRIHAQRSPLTSFRVISVVFVLAFFRAFRDSFRVFRVVRVSAPPKPYASKNTPPTKITPQKPHRPKSTPKKPRSLFSP